MLVMFITTVTVEEFVATMTIHGFCQPGEWG
jgi:hypothetical protein